MQRVTLVLAQELAPISKSQHRWAREVALRLRPVLMQQDERWATIAALLELSVLVSK
jgi:hypothetical protein